MNGCADIEQIFGAWGRGVCSVSMTPDERWLAANWPFVRASLPAAPARVAEVGCGPVGGFVPCWSRLVTRRSVVDPEAPRGPSYRLVEIERCDMPGRLEAIVACTSLHHVADLAAVLDLVYAALAPDGLARPVRQPGRCASRSGRAVRDGPSWRRASLAVSPAEPGRRHRGCRGSRGRCLGRRRDRTARRSGSSWC